MSIENNHENIPPQDVTCFDGEHSFFKPATVGMIPTAIAGLTKSALPLAGKVTAVSMLILAGLALAFKEIPHQHPPQFLDTRTGKPLQPGDVTEIQDPLTGKIQKKLVVGYSAHHKEIISKYATQLGDAGQILEAQMRQRPLWTGSYDLVAKGYAGKDRLLALVVADPEGLKNLRDFDVSGHGSFESFDASQAIAINVEGQEKFNVSLVLPSEISHEHKPGLEGQVLRVFSDANRLNIDPSVIKLAAYNADL
jgi:hypothetical protein